MGINDKAWGIGFKRMIGDESLGKTYGIAVDEVNRQLHICDIGDVGTDWARSASSHPELNIHSATTPATDYLKMYHDATNAYIDGVGATAINFQIAGTTEMSLAAASLTISAPLTVGVDDTGYDVTLFGATASAKLLWDESEDDLIFSGVARQIMGTSGTALVVTQGSPIMDIYTTCASTHASNSVNTFHVKNTMTGVAGVGGRAFFEMTTNVALGGWSNALKAYVEYGASGRTTGLGSAFVAELALSAGTTSGTYSALEAELIAEAGASAGGSTSFIYMNASDAATVINSAAGYLFEIGSGVTDTSGGIFEAEVNTDSMSMTHVLKIRIAATDYYIPLNTAKAF